MTGPTLPGVQGQQGDDTSYMVSVDSSMVGETIPANTVPKEVDARNRAWRTFLQQIALDILIAAAPLLYDAFTSSDMAFTQEYWVTVLVAVGKTAAAVAISYIMRLKKPPVGATE